MPTTEELEAEVASAAREGRIPFDWRSRGAPSRRTPDDPVGEDIFSVSDLGPGLAPSEPFVMPNGKRVFVFGITAADQRLLLEWALAEPVEAKTGVLQAALVRARTQVYQMILACRTGPTRESRRVFERGDVHAISANLGYAVIGSICSISDKLSGEDEAFSSGVLCFFGAARRCLQTWLSTFGNSTDCPAGLRAGTERLLLLVSDCLSSGSETPALLNRMGAATEEPFE